MKAGWLAIEAAYPMDPAVSNRYVSKKRQHSQLDRLHRDATDSEIGSGLMDLTGPQAISIGQGRKERIATPFELVRRVPSFAIPTKRHSPEPDKWIRKADQCWSLINHKKQLSVTLRKK